METNSDTELNTETSLVEDAPSTKLGSAHIVTRDGLHIEALGKNVNFVNHADRMVTEIHVDSPELAQRLAESMNAEIVSVGVQQPRQLTTTPTVRHQPVIGLFPAVTNCEYYNLIVAGNDDFSTGRTILKSERVIMNSYFNEDFIREAHLPLVPDVRRKLCSYPTIFCAEMEFADGYLGGIPSPDQKAKFGFIKRISVHNDDVWIDYDTDKLQDFPQELLFNNINDLDIDSRPKVTELSHTHWAVKYIDITKFFSKHCPNLIMPL